MNTDFFYRIDGLELVPGDKSAGFTLHVSTAALQALLKEEVSLEERTRVLTAQQERIGRWLGAEHAQSVENCGMAFYGPSGCPLMFTTDPAHGGSVGPNPEDLVKLLDGKGEGYFGTSIEMTPHNVDTPMQAMILVILVQTWAEWARGKLMEIAKRPNLRPMSEWGDLMTLDEFLEAEDVGGLTSDDGYGVYATATQRSDITTSKPAPEWATHVLWFNR